MKDAENDGRHARVPRLAFEDVSFDARDGVPLSGWWVPAEGAKGTVVLVHGLNRSRIEMVRKVPFVHSQGWNALLFDLRRHGKSGGTVRSLGYHEREDVLGAFDLARKRAPGPVVVLWGSRSAAPRASCAAAEEPRIAGVVCDSSYRSLRDTARHHLGLFRRFAWWLRVVPAWPTADEAVFWMGRRAGFDPDDVDVVKAASRLAGRPVLFVADSDDERMPSGHRLRPAGGGGAEGRGPGDPGEQPVRAPVRDGQTRYDERARARLSRRTEARTRRRWPGSWSSPCPNDARGRQERTR